MSEHPLQALCDKDGYREVTQEPWVLSAWRGATWVVATDGASLLAIANPELVTGLLEADQKKRQQLTSVLDAEPQGEVVNVSLSQLRAFCGEYEGPTTEPCPECGGKKQRPCPTCGEGDVDCYFCKGEGTMTRQSEIRPGRILGKWANLNLLARALAYLPPRGEDRAHLFISSFNETPFIALDGDGWLIRVATLSKKNYLTGEEWQGEDFSLKETEPKETE